MRHVVAKLCTRIILLSAVVGASWAHVIFAQMATDEHLPEGLGVAQIEPNAYRYLLEHGEYADGTILLCLFMRLRKSAKSMS